LAGLEGAFLAEGPGSFKLASGELEVLGARVKPGERVIVPAGRRVPVRARGAVVEEARVRWVEWSASEYERLDSLAGALAGEGRVVLVGPSDVGKSTLAAWIANKAGHPLLTVDVGQNEVYCPGFASRLDPEGLVVPGAPRGSVESCFVGAFSPRPVVGRYLYCAARLSRDAPRGLVVDTDGWVEKWDGIVAKAGIAESVNADVVLAVGLGDREVSVLDRLTGARVERLEPVASSGKSREERRVHRERLIAKCLEGAREVSYRVERVPVVGAPVFRGTPVDPEGASELAGFKVYYAELAGNELVVVAPKPKKTPGVRALKPGWEKGLIAAVHPHAGPPEAGIVLRVNYRIPAIVVATRAGPNAALVEVGSARVDPDAVLGGVKW